MINIYKIFKLYKYEIILTIIFSFLETILGMPLPFLSMYVIDNVISFGNIGLLNLICIGLIILIPIKFTINYITQYILIVMREKILYSIQEKMYIKILNLPYYKYKNYQSGYLQNRIISDTDSLGGMLTDTYLEFLHNTAFFLFGLIVMFYLNSRLTFLIIILLPIYIFVYLFFSKKVHRQSIITMEYGALFSGYIQDSIQNIKLIKAYTATKYATRKFFNYAKKCIKGNILTSMLYLSGGLIENTISSIGPIIILWYSGKEIISGNMTIGQFIAFNSFMGYVFEPLGRLLGLRLHMEVSLGALTRINEIMKLENETGGDIKRKTFDECIEFRNINLLYDNVNHVIRDVSFSILKGEIVGIVGRSGVGKTTLVNLLMNLYTPNSGSIYIDNININDISVQSLRNLISVVDQEVSVIFGSVKDNIKFGNSHATDNDVLSAAKMANATFIINEKQEVEGHIGANGQGFSGGQRQRISLARALLKGSPIFILDEAFSGLDSEIEGIIQEELIRMLKNRTIIIISHRLSSLKYTDKIIVLDKGKISQIGHIKELS